MAAKPSTEILPTSYKGGQVLGSGTRRKPKARARDASVIGEDVPRRPNRSADKVEKPVTCGQYIFKILIACVGTCSVIYLVLSLELGSTLKTERLRDLPHPGPLLSQASASGKRTTLPQGSELFTIDRSILDKLEYLHRASGDLEELDIVAWTNGWPPLVTHIPEPRVSRKYAEIVNLCGPRSTSQNPCRFLLPYRISEQESKARLHFLQLVSLAQALNRILVLPNVGKGRMGICFYWDFEAYYDTSGLEEQRVKFVRLDVFKAWMESQRATSSAVLMVITENTAPVVFDDQRPQNHGIQIIESEPNLDTGCMRTRFPNWPGMSQGTLSLNVVRPSRDATLEISSEFVEAVQNATSTRRKHDPDASSADFDVLTVHWALRHPIFLPSEHFLLYSPRLTELSGKISPPNSYIAVHWRVETVIPENLPQCAYALVDALRHLLHESALAEGIETVWVASDMSFEESRAPIAKSGTLKMFTPLHQEVIHIVRSAFRTGGELARWKLETLEHTLDISRLRNDYDAEWLNDSGVRGILDKIIAAEATLFIGGRKKCSRVR